MRLQSRLRRRPVIRAAALALALTIPVAAGCTSDATNPAEQAETTQTTDPTDTDNPEEFAFGQEVRVIDGAVTPKTLAADINQPIMIRNATEAPVEVLFTNPGWNDAGTTTTGALEPDETFEVEPIGIASISYTVAGTDISGVIQVEDGVDTL